MTPRHAAEPDDAELDIAVVAGDPTPAELAALTAVITAMAQESSDAAEESSPRVQSAWQRSQRAVRQPLERGRGLWRGFSG